ncbi:sugar translocase [Pseudomonas sp. FW306-2-2C-D06B]|uniref:GtrA family protein n=1 Tax=Pseudomonas sp. FW306-2-2C-D06B TaxID=2070645 RepID=UPI000C88167C|nr:GtrA family protein [Pseudomonas sp. FW306-2-2C-D06B]PMY78395.1 sugar translocase [Pseudomonas sp. FW306-2-2C-D06B]
MENQNPPLITLLIRYLGIGFIATGIHYVVFLVLVTTEFATPLLASICGGMVGAIASFIGNRALCFVADGSRKFQPVRFALVALATNFGNGVGMWFLIKSNLSPLISQVLGNLRTSLQLCENPRNT